MKKKELWRQQIGGAQKEPGRAELANGQPAVPDVPTRYFVYWTHTQHGHPSDLDGWVEVPFSYGH